MNGPRTQAALDLPNAYGVSSAAGTASGIGGGAGTGTSSSMAGNGSVLRTSASRFATRPSPR